MILKLVDDWKECLRWFSVNCMMIAATIQGVWATLPEDMRASIPTEIVSGLTIFVLVLGVAGRLIKQERRSVVSQKTDKLTDKEVSLSKKQVKK